MEPKKTERNTILGAVVMIAVIVALVATGRLNILLSILMIGVVICFHEFGHFLIARINGVTVKEFSIGFGPRLFSKVIRGTKWSVKLLPFGGSCLMLGDDEAITEDPDQLLKPSPKEVTDKIAAKDDAEEAGEAAITSTAQTEKADASELHEEEAEGTFRSKNVWQRIGIIFAGPFFNFVLAFLFACIIIGSIGYDPAYVTSVTEDVAAATGLQAGDKILEYEDHTIRIGRDLSLYESLDGVPEKITIKYERDGKTYEGTYVTKLNRRYMFGITYTLNQQGGHLPMTLSEVSGPAAQAGLKAGDVITQINGVAIATPEDFQTYINENPLTGQTISLVIDRNGMTLIKNVTPVLNETRDLGFGYNINYREKVGAFGVVKYGVNEVGYWIKATVKSLKFLIQGKAKRQDVGGAVRVVSEMSNVVDESYHSDGVFYAFLNLLNWAILLSANLGVMNLLPIPALDGGRLLFLFIEAVRGKPVNPKVEGYVTLVGFVLLILLMIVILFNDISNVFGMLLPI
ncbi:MAG: RIP metalloprotease RseP [Lachnospiraceae bacterium]|nr:RIP metalloprotease RseP [Lachnospiraceae bacterium]